MSLINNLKNLAGNIQQGGQRVTITLTQRLLRLISGLFMGWVLSLIIQKFTQSETLMLVFFTIFFALIIYKLLRPLSLFQIFVFNVICILVATLLRLYIIIAP